MFILKFFPDWLFYFVFIAGLLGLLLSHFLPQFVYTKLLKIVSAMVVLAGIYFFGALHEKNAWQAKVVDLQAKVAVLEAQSQTVNAEIQTKVVTKTQVVRERGQATIQYIDREIVKYDAECKIPPEFINAHNQVIKP